MSISEDQIISGKRWRWRSIWILLGVSLVCGVATPFCAERSADMKSAVGLVFAFMFTGLIYSWALNDAKSEGRLLSGRLGLAILFLPLLGLGLYVVCTKRLKQVLALLFGLSIVLPAVFLYALGGAVVETYILR